MITEVLRRSSLIFAIAGTIRNGSENRMSYLIDTDIAIYSLKGYPVVVERFQSHRDSPKSLSVVSYGELIFGAYKSKNVEKNLGVAHRVAELFPIINVSRAIMETFGQMKASLEKKGQSLDDMDLLIAATALTHNLVLVTNNEKHFNRVKDLEIENWTT
jgi:tRNA(fMet)-specific endonuclease VapC